MTDTNCRLAGVRIAKRSVAVVGASAVPAKIFEAVAGDEHSGVQMGISHSFGGVNGDTLGKARAATQKSAVLLAPRGFEPDWRGRRRRAYRPSSIGRGQLGEYRQ